jgi:guanine nucleotide-binding protein subunit alpha
MRPNCLKRFRLTAHFLPSNVYDRFFRGLTKRHLDVSQTHASPVQQGTAERDSTEQHYQTLLFVGSEYSGTDAILNKIGDTWKDFPIDIHLRLQQMVAYRFVILSMKAILTALGIAGINFQFNINMDHSAFLLGYVEDMTLTKPLDERVGGAIRSLWHDPCMETVRQSPQDFGVTDSTLGYVPQNSCSMSQTY